MCSFSPNASCTTITAGQRTAARRTRQLAPASPRPGVSTSIISLCTSHGSALRKAQARTRVLRCQDAVRAQSPPMTAPMLPFRNELHAIQPAAASALTPRRHRRSLKRVFGKTSPMRREKSNYIIQSVSHALDVLEQFFQDADELGVTELSKRLKLHKNNVFRLLATLESRGYIEQNRSTENYRLGVRCLQLGQSYVKHMGLLPQARPIMDELVRQARETAYVAVLRRDGVVPVEVVEADRAGAHRLARSARPCRSTAPRPARRCSRSRPRKTCARSCPTRCRSSPSARRPTAQALQQQLKSVGLERLRDRHGRAHGGRACASRRRSATTRATSSARSPSSGPPTASRPSASTRSSRRSSLKAGRDLSSRLGFDARQARSELSLAGGGRRIARRARS